MASHGVAKMASHKNKYSTHIINQQHLYIYKQINIVQIMRVVEKETHAGSMVTAIAHARGGFGASAESAEVVDGSPESSWRRTGCREGCGGSRQGLKVNSPMHQAW